MSDSAPPPAFQMDEDARPAIVFTLPFALMAANVRQRAHWAELTAYRKRLVGEVMAAIGGPRYFPRPSFDRVRVTVCRSSAGQLDPDNLVAACKPLLDVLCQHSRTHPGSLGIIEDDNPRQCELVVTQAPAAPGSGATTVVVEHVPGGPLPAPVKPGRRRFGGAQAPRKKQFADGALARISRTRVGL